MQWDVSVITLSCILNGGLMAIADSDHMLPFHPTNTIIIDIAKRKKNHDKVEKQKHKTK